MNKKFELDTSTKTTAEDARWLQLATGDDDGSVHRVLQYIQVTPDRMVSSDGKRLHIAKTVTGLNEDEARLIKVNEGKRLNKTPRRYIQEEPESDPGYPDVERVFPRSERVVRVPINASFLREALEMPLGKYSQLVYLDVYREKAAFSQDQVCRLVVSDKDGQHIALIMGYLMNEIKDIDLEAELVEIRNARQRFAELYGENPTPVT